MSCYMHHGCTQRWLARWLAVFSCRVIPLIVVHAHHLNSVAQSAGVTLCAHARLCWYMCTHLLAVFPCIYLYLYMYISVHVHVLALLLAVFILPSMRIKPVVEDRHSFLLY